MVLTIASVLELLVTKSFHFDKDYYDRFYRNPMTRVADQQAVRRLGTFVCSYVHYLSGKVQRVLDIGCGVGHWREVIAEQFPRASYTGVEFSDYVCKEYGWEQGSVVDYEATQPFDLVICQGVLQYLPDDEAEQAIKNLAQLCRQFLYLEVLTERDWQCNCDRSVTDGSVYLREGKWYRERLAPHFQNLGGGLFAARKAGLVLYEMEVPD